MLRFHTYWAIIDCAIAFSVGILATVPHMSTPLSFSALSEAAQAHVWSAILFAACVTTLSRLFGLHSFKTKLSIASELLLIAQNVSVSACGVYGGMHFWHAGPPPGQTLPAEMLLTTALIFASRHMWRRNKESLSRRGIASRNFIIAGADPLGIEVRDYLTSLRYSGYRFKGFVTLDDEAPNSSAFRQGEIVGSINELTSLARFLFVDEVIFARRPSTPNVLADFLHVARDTGIDVRLIPSLSETVNHRAFLEYVGDLPTFPVYRRKLKSVSRIVKRAIDLVVATIGILFAMPVLLVIAIAIKLSSPGPVFYRSKRLGYKGSAFTCYKFRTMVPNADKILQSLAHLNERDGILFKMTNDPRITRVGAFLRKYSLDELPQLWNVIKGDMSLVGPRPPLSSEVAQYQTAHLRRLDVVPGITGLWQVEARNDPSFDNYASLDGKYVNDWSVWLDLTILFRTARVVVMGTGS
jgi:exopolysaccharide biosynthesis polyprenyl glycosylphosphotransferase